MSNLAKRKLGPDEIRNHTRVRLRVHRRKTGVLVPETCSSPRPGEFVKEHSHQAASPEVIEELKERLHPEPEHGDPIEMLFRALGDGNLWSGQ